MYIYIYISIGPLANLIVNFKKMRIKLDKKLKKTDISLPKRDTKIYWTYKSYNGIVIYTIDTWKS